ncbi:hypothetical protein [Rugamonas sp.]|uniref:hypothetical protein n=1 Tax=Rugamonas sp. TaxID=1926287 RepID=UPI0025EDB149|nr:hypothetical protein [Rugamonas sp.]
MTAADLELSSVEQLGAQAGAIFGRIANVDGDTTDIFSPFLRCAWHERQLLVDLPAV